MKLNRTIISFIFGLFVYVLSFASLAWVLDKSNVDWRVELSQAEQSRFDIFQNAIANHNLNPREAAALAGDTDFKKLSDGYYQIRLSQRARVKMDIDWVRELVKILQVGGHT